METVTKSDNKETVKDAIVKDLVSARYYDPHDVFHHYPEFWQSKDERYLYEVRIVKWNTRSTRVTILNVRFDEAKQRFIFSKKKGASRTPHGEKMR